MRRCLVLGLASLLIVAGVLIARSPGTETANAASPCQFQKSTSNVAFCDTFDHAAAPNSSRSGALDPTVWGVSYISSLDNSGQGLADAFAPAIAPAACGLGTLIPPRNVQICNGHLFDSNNDGGGQTIVAMYPRQPFDIAGRTGDVTFDVANDNQGSHSAWPSFVYTDQPVPAPYQSEPAIDTYARNSFGFDMDSSSAGNDCPSGQWSVGTMWKTAGYALQAVGFTRDACVGESTNPTVQSHVEVQMSSTGVTVWASNPGSSALVKIASASLTMPLTRGLLWMEDAHYNADKFGTLADNTFGWDNFGFDGPILPRDRGFDVPSDSQAGSILGSVNLGWRWDSAPVNVQTLPVDATSMSRAQGALVEFNWFPYTQTVPTISLNGHAPVSTSWPFQDGTTYSWRTIAVPIPLSDVVQGANQITVAQAGSAEGSIANFDLILVGAGGVPTCLDPSNCSSDSGSGSSSAPPPTPTPAPAPTPQQLNNAPCTVNGISGRCTGTFTPA